MRIVFDLDGTLIDSARDIHAAVNAMLDEVGHPPLSLQTVTGFVGNGLPHLVGLVIDQTGLDRSDHVRLSERVLHHYTHPRTHLTVPYPGAVAALGALHDAGHALGICTNKPHAATLRELDRLDLRHYFSAINGGDSFETRKPDAAPLLNTLSELGDGPALFVGDSEVDTNTARNAQVPFALFTKGYRKTPIADLPHELAFDDFAELTDFVADMG